MVAIMPRDLSQPCISKYQTLISHISGSQILHFSHLLDRSRENQRAAPGSACLFKGPDQDSH